MSIGNLCSTGKKESGSSRNLYLISLRWYVSSGVYSNIFFWSTSIIENKEQLRSYLHTLPSIYGGINGIPVMGFVETSLTARTPAFTLTSGNVTQDELWLTTTSGLQSQSVNIWNNNLQFTVLISA